MKENFRMTVESTIVMQFFFERKKMVVKCNEENIFRKKMKNLHLQSINSLNHNSKNKNAQSLLDQSLRPSMCSYTIL